MTTYLETERIILRRFTLSDAQLLADLDSDPEMIRYTQARIRYDGKTPPIKIFQKYWGQGLATEGSKALIKKSFEDLDILEVFSGALIANGASIRVMEKCGLKFSKSYHHEISEAIEYKLSIEEWQENQN